MKYSTERKEAVLRKMMPPHNKSVIQLAKEEGSSDANPIQHKLNEAQRKDILLPHGDSSLEGSLDGLG